MDKNTPLALIEQMFDEYGAQRYTGLHEEPVSALDHALQCAALAREAGASRALVVAALLHDIGHFLPHHHARTDERNDEHERSGAQWLARWFPPSVTDPIGLHVDAKRYLCATEPGYHDRLSPASVHSLTLQGGVFSAAQVSAFISQAHAHDAVQLRCWDDQAKQSACTVAGLTEYLADAAAVLIQPGH